MNELRTGLEKLLGPGKVYAEPFQVNSYCYDAADITRKQVPVAVVLPETTEEVSAVVKYCCSRGIEIIPRGAGTNVAGATLPARHSVVISLNRMNKVLEYSPSARTIRVQAGMVNMDVTKVAAPDGLFFAPDPSSHRVSTVGGNAAENCGGAHCFKYGVMTDHVTSIKTVEANGKIGEYHRPWPGLNSGFDVIGLWVGSEGTLGIITELTLHLLPLPREKATVLATFTSLANAFQTVEDIVSNRMIPAAIEVMDKASVEAVEKFIHAGYPLDAEAVLLLEVDGNASPREQIELIKQLAYQNGAQKVLHARDQEQAEKLMLGRKALYGACGQLSSRVYVQDVTVPRNQLVEMMQKVERIARKYRLKFVTVSHAGDGNLHPIVAFDPGDKEEVERLKNADKEIISATLKMKGSISGEHGIGLLKKESMKAMWGENELLLMKKLRKIFDPAEIFNRGKVYPEVFLKSEAEQDESAVAREWLNQSTELVVAPGDETEWLETVKAARDAKLKVKVRGTGLRQELSPYSRPGVIIDTGGWNEVKEFNRENLSITVQSGITLQELQEIVGKENLWLPIEDEEGPVHSLGGSVALNWPGPRGLRYKSFRHYVLGMKVLLAAGQILNLGGSVVKNVAGLDCTKLFIGSRGLLGAILELTLRLLPYPPKRKTVIIKTVDIATAWQLAHSIYGKFQPGTLELLDRKLLDESKVNLAVELEGPEAEVDWMEKEIRNLAGNQFPADTDHLSKEQAAQLWRDRADLSMKQRLNVPSWQVVLPTCDSLQVFWDFAKEAGYSLHGGICAGNYRLHGGKNLDGGILRQLADKYKVKMMALNDTGKDYATICWGDNDADKLLVKMLNLKNVFV